MPGELLNLRFFCILLSLKICTGYTRWNVFDTESYPESCAADCFRKDSAFTGFDLMVGLPTYQNQISQCVCQSSWDESNKPFKYGIDCKSGDPINVDGFECIHGRHDPKNTISGCSCTDLNGFPTPFHGWFCDVPNYKLCGDNKYYRHSKAESVADTFHTCKSCGFWTNHYCKTCIQDETGNSSTILN